MVICSVVCFITCVAFNERPESLVFILQAAFRDHVVKLKCTKSGKYGMFYNIHIENIFRNNICQARLSYNGEFSQ